MNTNPLKETKEEKNQVFNKWYWIGLAITTGATILLAVIIFFIRYYSGSLGNDYRLLVSLADAFGVSGILVVLFFIIVWISNFGAFDAIAYSVSLAWTNIFHHKERNTRLPKNYYEYRELKRGKKRANMTYMLFPGLLFLIVGIVLIVIYNVK